MSILHIYDVSQYIRAGIGSYTLDAGIAYQGGTIVPLSVPASGIRYLLNSTGSVMQSKAQDVIFVFDSSPLIKREIHSQNFSGGYKGTRPPTPLEISVQRDLAYDLLRLIGCDTRKVDGYESDDVIYSIIKDEGALYDKIYIYNNDADLFFLVSDKVTNMPPHTKARTITKANYADSVNKDYTVPYNTVLLNKILMGDPKDNIPPIWPHDADTILESIPKQLYPELGDIELLRSLCMAAVKDTVRTKAVIDLVLPMYIHTESISPAIRVDVLSALRSELSLSSLVSYAPSLFDDVLLPVIKPHIEHYINERR